MFYKFLNSSNPRQLLFPKSFEYSKIIIEISNPNQNKHPLGSLYSTLYFLRCFFVIQNLYSIYMTTKNYLQQYISQKVKYFRTQNKMSQEELSEQAGLGLKYINQLENQNVNLTIHSLEKVIDALEMTPEEFFNFDSLESTSDKSDNLSLKRINMKIKQLPIDKREKMLVIFESILDNLWYPWLTYILTGEYSYSQIVGYG